ncbi:hypothetical protein [Micromonospora sp. NPDC050695]|uniref:hypothetical protein n=1 Tax=Micromonospora sp. NPDC050695 TaxID=3154938 RepID=UPI0034026145
MGTKTRTDGFTYAVPYHVWATRRAGTILAAKQSARRKRARVDGDPIVTVVLEWPQDEPDDGTLPLEHC